MRPIFFLNSCLFLFCFFPKHILAQDNDLKIKIEKILQPVKATVGVAIHDMEAKDDLFINGSNHFPMQSVYKFPLAMAILDQVDKGKFSLDQKIHITEKDVNRDTYSPLRDKYPHGNADVALSEILSYTVSQSDNTGCDILFRLLGGPSKLNDYVHGLGIKNIAIAATEEEMHRAWDVQFTNWCEPGAMLQLLDIFYKRKNLSPSSSEFLWKIMIETSTGTKRIKGLLPAGTIVAHKTGLSGTNSAGITAATNDVGIVTLPNGKHFAIVVFVSDSPENEAVREGTIAQIAKAAWDYYVGKK